MGIYRVPAQQFPSNFYQKMPKIGIEKWTFRFIIFFEILIFLLKVIRQTAWTSIITRPHPQRTQLLGHQIEMRVLKEQTNRLFTHKRVKKRWKLDLLLSPFLSRSFLQTYSQDFQFDFIWPRVQKPKLPDRKFTFFFQKLASLALLFNKGWSLRSQ